MTWYAALTNGDVDLIDWCPEEYLEIAGDLEVICQSVKDAIKRPLEITEQEKQKTKTEG